MSDADLVLCPSMATMNDCIEAGFDEQRLRFVPHGVIFAACRRPRRSRSALATRTRRATTCCGRARSSRGRTCLVSLRAWAQLEANADLVLVGPQGWNEDLDKHIGAARDRVKVLGFLPQRRPGPHLCGRGPCSATQASPRDSGCRCSRRWHKQRRWSPRRGTSTEEIAEGAGASGRPERRCVYLGCDRPHPATTMSSQLS